MPKKKRLNRVRCSSCNKIVGHDSSLKTIEKCPECHSGKKKKGTKKTAAGGFAATKKGPCLDLPKQYRNYSFRSGWEMNFARVLVAQKREWTYERVSFTFTTSPTTGKPYRWKPWVYIPDFHDLKSGILWEVKGYLRSEDRSKMKRFKANYPEEFKMLKAVVGRGNKKAKAFYSQMGIPMVFYEDLRDEYKDKVNWV